MAGISRAKLFFTVGVEFENAWIPRIRDNATDLKIVPIDSGIEKLTMTEHHDDEAKHASGHEEGLDPHTWLSPKLAKIEALKIMNSLSSVDPTHKETYLANYQQFAIEIDSLQMKIKGILANCPHPTPFMVFHPSWGYFAKEFDLQQIPIEIEGKEPSPREMVSILSIAKEKQIKTIFIQPQFSARSAQQIAHEIGAQTAVANDLAENWAENLEHVAQMIGNCK
jgi:zinc transport system substrate-binding protein